MAGESKFTRTTEKLFVITHEASSTVGALAGALAALKKRATDDGYVSHQYVPKTLLFTTVQSVSTDEEGHEIQVWSTEASAIFWIVAVA